MAVRCTARREEEEIREERIVKEAWQSSEARGNGRRVLFARDGQGQPQYTLHELRCDTTVVAPASSESTRRAGAGAVDGVRLASERAGSRDAWA